MYVWFLPDAEGKPQLEQANNYYPFGMAYTKNAADSEEESFARENKYKYNGKEEQPMPGKWLDYGARFYDAQIARFHSVDPLAHSFPSQSPYVYAGNNPILNIDFMGLSAMSNVSNNRTSSFTFGMTDEDWIKATRPIGLEGIESKEKKKKTDKNTESQTSQQNGDNPQKGNDEKQKLSLKDKDLAKKVIELMNEIEQKKSYGNLTEIFDKETLYFDRNETTKTVAVVYKNSIVEVTIVNPKYAPDYGYYYQIKSRPYQTFGRATFGSIDISGQKSVVSLRIYNEKVYNQCYNEVFKNN